MCSWEGEMVLKAIEDSHWELGELATGNALLDRPRPTEGHSLKESTKKVNVSSTLWTTES